MKRRVGAVLVSNKRVISTGRLVFTILTTCCLKLRVIHPRQAIMEHLEACATATKVDVQDAIRPLSRQARLMHPGQAE